MRSWRALLTLTGAVVLLLAAHPVPAASSKASPDELKEAINAEYKFSKSNWDSAILNGSLSNLKLESIHWSAKPARVEFTVFTQLTLDRLPTLFNMCRTWTGPLSAAVFVAVVQPGPAGGGTEEGLSSSSAREVAEAAEEVKRWFDKMEALPDACQLDVMLMYEVYDSRESALLYPVNYLRNYARLQVRTRLMAMIDVDMLMSASFSAEMRQPGRVRYYESLCPQLRATVLPAFEPTRTGGTGRTMAWNISQMSKEVLSSVHGRNKVAMQFKLRVFPRGHTPTDYVRFFASEEPYQVQYKKFFEPWFITCAEALPWYDERFRGYGMNKIILIASLNFYNYTFWVNPSAWLVHSPHGDTAVRKVVAEDASRVNKYKAKLPANALYRQLTLLFGVAKRAMMRGDYEPVVDARLLRVFDRVKWLQSRPKLKGHPIPESFFI